MFNNSTNSSVDVEVLDQWGGGGGGEEFPGAVVRDPLYVIVPMTCVYALILVSGMVGNVSTCVVIVTNKHMHTATNYYLCSLAMSDLLLLVTGLPVEMYHIWSRFPYVFGEVFCQVTSYTAETAANATVLTITAFTVERYVAICHPFFSYTVSKLSRAVKFIVAIWVLALCLAVPQAIQFGIVLNRNASGSELPNTDQCTLKWQFVQHAFHISTVVFFVAPMTLITVLYVLIGLRLRRSKMVKRTCADNNQSNVIRMLVAVVVAFFICWAPFHSQRLLAVYLSSRGKVHSEVLVAIYNALTYVSGILYFVSTTINPVLYNIMSNKFRQAFKSTLTQICRSNRPGSSPQSRTYSMLSRVGPHTNFVPLRASVSSGNRPPCVEPALDKTLSKSLNRKLRLLPAVHTISNSSLQETELTGCELVDYYQR